MKKRCEWATGHPLEEHYHDEEWGIPVHEDKKLFEMLILEGQQAGLSWRTILMKRENYREALDDFNPEKIVKYDDKKLEGLLKNPGIIRNKLKVKSFVSNAKAFLEVKEEFGSFNSFIWNFVGGSPIQNKWKSLAQIPAKTLKSDEMSKALKKRGFKFIGSTICYAFMQAVGMVNDHQIDCFRYNEV